MVGVSVAPVGATLPKPVLRSPALARQPVAVLEVLVDGRPVPATTLVMLAGPFVMTLDTHFAGARPVTIALSDACARDHAAYQGRAVRHRARRRGLGQLGHPAALVQEPL
jgi:hypothetical protein